MDYSKYKTLIFKRKFLNFLGTKISIYSPDNSMVGFVKMKIMSLKGDVRVFTDESMQTEIVRIGGRQIISARKVYDVFDSKTGSVIAAIRQRSIVSLYLRDHMDIVDASGNQIGYIQETSSTLAVLGRWLSVLVFAIVPQKFDIVYDPTGSSPQLVARIVHHKNPIVVNMTLDTSEGQHSFDPRLNIAIVALLMILDVERQR